MKKRKFWEVDDVELNAAVAAMCDGLGVSGSVTPLYDLYRAVLGEKRKAAAKGLWWWDVPKRLEKELGVMV